MSSRAVFRLELLMGNPMYSVAPGWRGGDISLRFHPDYEALLRCWERSFPHDDAYEQHRSTLNAARGKLRRRLRERGEPCVAPRGQPEKPLFQRVRSAQSRRRRTWRPSTGVVRHIMGYASTITPWRSVGSGFDLRALLWRTFASPSALVKALRVRDVWDVLDWLVMHAEHMWNGGVYKCPLRGVRGSRSSSVSPCRACAMRTRSISIGSQI
ncbi:hypothetical protein EI94DRAFT_1705133 [Lactarius quietus]|nr:hypothetical protein EI94DRAFT_1705133 [Lactarius quietus]